MPYNDTAEAYPEIARPGDEQHQRAVQHRQLALDALSDGETASAIVHMLAAIEARIEELTVFVAQPS